MDQVSSSGRGRLHYGWVVLVFSTLSVFGALGLGRFSYTMILPAMQEGLLLSNSQAGVLASFNLTGYLVCAMLGGAMASRFGPRVVVAAGLAVVGVGMCLTGASSSFAAAAVWRTVTGLGSGAAYVGTMGVLSSWFAKSRRGFATGTAVAGSSLAMVCVGPTVPLILAAGQEMGWRLCWLVYGGAVVLLAGLGFLFLRNHPCDVGIPPVEENGAQGVCPPARESPEWGRVYGNLLVWALGIVYACYGLSYIIYFTFFTKHLVAEAGWSVRQAGNLFTLMGWTSIFCGLLWGSVSDRIGRRAALAIVFLIQAVSFGLFGVGHSPVALVASALLFGITAWGIPAVVAAASGDILGPLLAPAGFGFLTFLFGLGQAAGPWVAGVLADATGSFLAAFLLASGTALAGACGILWVGRVSRRLGQRLT